MASDTATAKPDRRWFGRATARKPKAEAGHDRPEQRRRLLPGSRLGRLIIALNLIGLAILIVGALVLNEFRQGLVQARIDSLRTQGELIAKVMAIGATRGSPEPAMDSAEAGVLLQALFIPASQRVRVFDARGQLVADSYLVADRVEQSALPPARRRNALKLSLPPPPPGSEAQVQAQARAARTA